MRALVVLAALLAFGAVAFYAVQTYPALIETDLKRRASDALASADLQFARVDVKGRVVTLSGEAPGPMAKEDAVKIAANVWGVESVTNALTVDSAAMPVSPQTVVPPASQPAEPTAPQQTQAQSAPAAEPPPAEPPPAEPTPAPALPSIASAIDPSLGSSSDSEPAETAPAPAEQPAPATEQPSTPPPPVPQQTATAEQAPAPEPPAASAPSTPPPAANVAPATPSPAPAPPAAGPPVGAALQAPATPSPAPAPPAAGPPVGAALQATLAQGATTGLTSSVQAAAPAAVPAPPAYRLEARVEGKRVELQGLVSTPSAERALVAHVRRHVRRAQVVDSLQVAHTKPDKDWLSVARKSLSQLAHLDTGTLKLDGRAIAVSGKPKSDSHRARLLAALNDLPHGYTSTVLLERKQELAPVPPPAPAPAVVASVPEPAPAPPPRAALPKPHRIIPRHTTSRYRALPRHAAIAPSLSTDCRWRFGDVLPRVAVAFESGSSRPSAVIGLDDLARVARVCPRARIVLTGHSDTREVSAREMRLSRLRALAVRDALEARGVAGANISVAGLGGLRPAFSNATPDGRENNRRVEFAVR